MSSLDCVIYSCPLNSLSGALLWPLLQHTSHPSETHYFPLSPNSRILLHTHASGPFIASPYTRGLNLTVYSTGDNGCSVNRLDLTVDWSATIGRLGVRYAAPAVSYGVAIVALLLYDAWRAAETAGAVPSVGASLVGFIGGRLPMLLLSTTLISLIPLPADMWLGNRGEWLLSAIAPWLLLIVTGLVAVSWGLVATLIWLLRMVSLRVASYVFC